MMTLSLLKRLSLVLLLAGGLSFTACDDDDDDNGGGSNGGGGGAGAKNSASATFDGEDVSIGNANLQQPGDDITITAANQNATISLTIMPDTLSTGVWDSTNSDTESNVLLNFDPTATNSSSGDEGTGTTDEGLSVDIIENSDERVEGTFPEKPMRASRLKTANSTSTAKPRPGISNTEPFLPSGGRGFFVPHRGVSRAKEHPAQPGRPKRR